MRAHSAIALSAVLLAASAAWGQSLMDIKAEELQRPAGSAWGKDPFIRFEDRQALTGEKAYLPEFRVEGIITDGAKSLAIIEGGFYREGDQVQGFVISAIKADRVVLKRDGKTYEVKVQGFAVHAPAGARR